MMLFTALRKELLEQVRSYRMLVVLVVFLLFGLLSPVLAKLTPELFKLMPGGDTLALLIPPPTAADAVAQYLKNLSQFGIILALLLGMGAVAQEKTQGTAALILTKPMPRSSFLLAKFGALKLTFAVGILFAAAAGYYYTLFLFEPLSLTGWLALNAFLFLFLLVHVALTLLCSTLVRSQAAAGALAFAEMAVLGILASLPGVGDYLPAQLLTWGAGLAIGGSQSYWGALMLSVAIILVTLVAAWLALEQQEL